MNKLSRIEQELNRVTAPPHLIGTVKRDGDSFIWNVSRSLPEAPTDLIIQMIDSTDDLSFFEANTMRYRSELEARRQEINSRLTSGDYQL